MVKPNFFIVGAAKSGTTSLSTYLREHPQVYMPQSKEPNYFSVDLPGFQTVHSAAEYAALFQDASPDQWRIGEASVLYLQSPAAPALVHAYAPDARIIIMVRGPVDLLRSWHAQMVYNRDEDQADYVQAWDLRFDRRLGRRLPPRCRDQRVLWYDEVARLGEQTERWQRQFGADQVKVVLFDDFQSNPGVVYRDVLEFLGLPDDGRTDFPITNARKRQRLVPFANFTERPPKFLVRLANAAKRPLAAR